MTRDEHLQWCKERALAYCDAGDVINAMASMSSDLLKHPETKKHAGIMMGTLMILNGHLSSPQAMRDFINGFN